MTDNVRYRDFSGTAEPVRFKIDNDVFEAPAVLPIPVMQELVNVADRMKNLGHDSAALNAIVEVFNVILTDASARRFGERIASKSEPIGIRQVIDIMMWLLEAYGLRPTEPSSDSSTGLPGESDGTPSVAGALAVG